MFKAEYSRMKFWIISMCLILPFSLGTSLSRALMESAETYSIGRALAFVALATTCIWLNTLANRIRSHGSNPWISLLALIPLVNILLALYYGIAKGTGNIKN